MKKYIAILASLCVIATVSSCKKTADEGDDEKSDNDTTSYKLNPQITDKDEEKIGNIDSAAIAEDVLASQKVTEIAIVDEPAHKNEIKTQEEKYSSEAQSDAKKRDQVIEEAKVAFEPKAKPQNDHIVDMAMVEQKPSFPGGDAALYKWLGNQIMYPSDASEAGIQGKVIVSFVIEKDGSISNARVLRSKHPSLDAEALRVVKKMPRWTPGRNNGQTVRVKYNLPVTFKLQQ